MAGAAVTGLAYGVFSDGPGGRRALGVRVGERVVDLGALARRRSLPQAELLVGSTLNPLLAAGRAVWDEVHAAVAAAVEAGIDEHLVPGEVRMHLPFEVADYVDFYSSETHATNVGRIFRPGSPPLTPNWKHLPIGYHGRAGTVVVSGTPVVRPSGQQVALGEERPRYGPSQRLDIEAEVGFVVGGPTALGTQVTVDSAADHIFGVVLVNDWSARDLQAWEYVPLGPFLGKSFATSVSAWVVPLSTLDSARVAPPPRDVPLLAYLRETQDWGLDLQLEIRLNGQVLARPRFAAMYWTATQQLAHLTVNGASLRAGDLFASGTVSDETDFGSLLELTWGGQNPVAGRTFLLDGDEVVITASAPGPGGGRVELGEVRGTIAPARSQ